MADQDSVHRLSEGLYNLSNIVDEINNEETQEPKHYRNNSNFSHVFTNENIEHDMLRDMRRHFSLKSKEDGE